MTARDDQVAEWLAREAEIRAVQRHEAHQRARAFSECERTLGHVFTDSDVCVNCLCRVPGVNPDPDDFPSF